MKNLIVLMIFGVIIWFWTSCQDVTIGYLLVEDASYDPDSLVIKSENTLDAAGVDRLRMQWGIPWVSGPIEGVEGTFPISVSIGNITSLQGDPDKLWKVLSVRGDGTFEIPLHHDVPTGHYMISLNFKNEGYSKDLNDCFTIIVK